MSQNPTDVVNVTIDGKPIQVKKGTVLIEAARQAGVFVPHYCYDPDLSIVASCRLCLVEIEKIPKLQPSCSTPASEGQVVFTQSEKVLDARRMQMEFLLVQHPLDCPVCDQGGECKLQEFSRNHGYDESRFRFKRRTFNKPNIGPFVDIERNRCILCSRCVRFLDEKAGNAEFAIVQRGNHAMISTFQERPLQGEFTGNTIDLCPVGALTSKVTRFRVRVWELHNTSSVCSMCSSGCNVTLQHRNRTHEVLRVIPRENSDVNHRWICDVGRFGFDQFNSETRPRKILVNDENGTAQPTEWGTTISHLVSKLKSVKEEKGGSAIAGILGPQNSNETGLLFQQFFREVLGSNNIDHRIDHKVYSNDDAWLTSLAGKAVNQPFEEIRRAGTIVMIGTDLPNDLPMVRFMVREEHRKGTKVYTAYSRTMRMEQDCDARWQYHPGNEAGFLAATLHKLAGLKQNVPAPVQDLLGKTDFAEALSTAQVSEDHVSAFAQHLAEAESPTLLLGEDAFEGPRGVLCTKLALAIASLLSDSEPLPLSLLLPGMNQRGLGDVGCYPHRGPGFEAVETPGKNTSEILKACVDGSIEVLVLMNANLLETYPDRSLVENALDAVPFLVVADTYAFGANEKADVFIPLAAYTEQDGTYTNVGGRVQRGERAMAALDGTLAGYQVLLALGERWGSGWRQVRPPRLFDFVAQASSAYQGLSWAKLGTMGVVLDPTVVAKAVGAIQEPTLPSLNGSPTAEHPLRLTRGRYLFDLASEKRFAEALVDRSEPCVAEIHPDDATTHDIQEGQPLTVQGDLGAVRLPARISIKNPKGTVTVLGRHEQIEINRVSSEETPWVNVQP